ncbi:MAG: phosphoglycerol geranylgeranyltransferase [Methanocorpusculum sp.]|nr:phosphoglycerol geranylgeranyltransferase [Methanocorpusculum sp.]
MSGWRDWRHVTKLDPDKLLPAGAAEELAASGTDALMLSGTLDVTPEKLAALYDEVRDAGIPLVVEPANPSGARFDGFEHVFVPAVLNAGHPMFLSGMHKEWVKRYAIEWEKVVPEGYIVLNPTSSVGKLTHADCALSPSDAAGYAVVAERFFSMPVVYVEYSGMYGDPAVVRAVSDAVSCSRVFYGGGINSAGRAAEMSAAADTIVVGNAVYDAGIDVLRDTVRAVRR